MRRMTEAYESLKHKLEELGYMNTLPVDAVPLVECVIADLLQTTLSLQNYMKKSKEAEEQRDCLILEIEPYKCQNANLIKENNRLHSEIIKIKEDFLRQSKEQKRKAKLLGEELTQKDLTISKLQHDLRDLGLRSLCSNTYSSRMKCKKKDSTTKSHVDCNQNLQLTNKITELNNNLLQIKEENNTYIDEICLLKNQLENRNSEMMRLKDIISCNPTNKITNDSRIQGLTKQIQELEAEIKNLKQALDVGLEKQHEAMARALSLAEKNKELQDEIVKVDNLALKVEEEGNKKILELKNEISYLKSHNDTLKQKIFDLENESVKKSTSFASTKVEEMLNNALKDKQELQDAMKNLLNSNKVLQEKIVSLSESNNQFTQTKMNSDCSKKSNKYPTRDEINEIMQSERTLYEKHIADIQEKLTEAITMFNNFILNGKQKETCSFNFNDTNFTKELNVQLCQKEQKILMLKKEIDDMQETISNLTGNQSQNWKDIVSQLNVENTELSKENIMLSQQLSQYKNVCSLKATDDSQSFRKLIIKLKGEIRRLNLDLDCTAKDRDEYKLQLKEAKQSVDKLKSELTLKQADMEQLLEENCSYKITQRSGQASAERLKDECKFLRKKIDEMQNEVIKEKSFANQMKNIQIETERSSSELQNEVIILQKQISIITETQNMFENKCKTLQMEVQSLKSDKDHLRENIKRLDEERDRLVLDLDNKTELCSVLESRLRAQALEMAKMDEDLKTMTSKNSNMKISQHKLHDYESQLKYLNGQIERTNQLYENAIIENKELQSALLDANTSLKVSKIESGKYKKEIEELKQKLHHHVTEIKRIEEMLSHKEAERSDMLEHYASLTVEANILENTNHSLENESASKSAQLQSYITRIEELESNVLSRNQTIDELSSTNENMKTRIRGLESEIKLLKEEKQVLEQNVSHLKQMCNSMQLQQIDTCGTDSELNLYENKIKTLSGYKSNLEEERNILKNKLINTEKLLMNAKSEIVDLKLALDDATSETKSLKDQVYNKRKFEREIHETTTTSEMIQSPVLIQQSLYEMVHEDEDSSRLKEILKKYSDKTESRSTL